jgi:hypothetical protein
MHLNPERILGGVVSLIFIVGMQAFVQGLLYAMSNGLHFQSFTDVEVIIGLLAPFYVFYGCFKLLQNPKPWVLLFGLAGFGLAAVKILFLSRILLSSGPPVLPAAIPEVVSLLIIGIGCIVLRRYYSKPV